MPILPVLDLMGGQIVRGVGGRRDEYRPIVSTLVDSAEPSVVASALHARFGFTGFYLADLDAIQHGRPTVDIYADLHRAGLRLWVDAGLRGADDPTLPALIDARAATIVVGLESVGGPKALREIVEKVEAERIVFSLDLKAGKPIVKSELWKANDALAIAQCAIVEAGVQRLIVLDLARVGVGAGIGTEDLCIQLKSAYPKVQLAAGGGVRGTDDVRRFLDIGVENVLVASALHDGRITPDQVRSLSEPEA